MAQLALCPQIFQVTFKKRVLRTEIMKEVCYQAHVLTAYVAVTISHHPT